MISIYTNARVTNASLHSLVSLYTQCVQVIVLLVVVYSVPGEFTVCTTRV